MISFFRKIRRQLANDNRFLQYSRYAIGEILLVVIGILIALQINNWNIKRLERLEEVEILHSVKNDLENTIGEFEFLNQIRDKVLYGTKGIYAIANSQNADTGILDSLVGLTFYRPTFNNKQGAIDLLFTSGKINLIKNDSIREFLIAWPGSIDDMAEEEVYASTLFQEYYYPVVAKYILVQDVLAQIFSTSFFGTEVREEQYSALPASNDYEGLLKDRGFLNHLRMRASHMQITKGETRDLILQARKLIGSIDREID